MDGYSFMMILLIFETTTNYGYGCGEQGGFKHFPGASQRIIGGSANLGYHYPWFANLQYIGTNINTCAGSLIHSRYVLTAAHCFSGINNKKPEEIFNVVLGLYNTCQPDEITKRVYKTIKVHIHNKYKTNGTFFDIALIKLDKDASMFTPICLPNSQGVTKPRAAQILGYGSTAEGSNSEPCAMRTALLTLFTRSECFTSNNPANFWGPGTLCAGLKTGYVDSCQGDSGGPLQAIINGRYTILGIVSFGIGCGRPGLPGVYTDVSKYLNWMYKKIYNTEEEDERTFSDQYRKKRVVKEILKRTFKNRYYIFQSVGYNRNSLITTTEKN